MLTTITNPDFWLHVLEVLILAAGAFFAIRQLRLQREEYQSNSLREIRRHSMEMDARLSEFTTERLKVESAFPPSEWSEPIPLERLKAAFQADKDLEAALRQIIVQMDLLALPICAGAADEDMAFELVGSTVVAYAINFRNYIFHLRTSQNRPDFYIYLTTLVDRQWEASDKSERALLAGGSLPLFLRSNHKVNRYGILSAGRKESLDLQDRPVGSRKAKSRENRKLRPSPTTMPPGTVAEASAQPEASSGRLTPHA